MIDVLKFQRGKDVNKHLMCQQHHVLKISLCHLIVPKNENVGGMLTKAYTLIQQTYSFADYRHTSIIVMEESGRRRGPTDEASAVNVNLDAKSSLESVSTCIKSFMSLWEKWVNFFYKQIVVVSRKNKNHGEYVMV